MVYHTKFVAVIKCGGKVLRESNDGTVSLPFGSEYSILLKNLNSVRALVKVSVDGTDATEGTKLIVPANSSITLERFIRNGNLKSGNRFRFIERTEAIEEHRGIGAEDGLIRVEYWFESAQKPPAIETTEHHHHHHHHGHHWLYPPYQPYQPYQPAWSPYTQTITYTCDSAISGMQQGNVMCSTAAPAPGPVRSGILRSIDLSTMESGNQAAANDAISNDAGITVPGSRSDQEFTTGEWFPVETASSVIVIRLRGAVGQRRVERPVTTDVKPKCPTCGRTNKATSCFCSQCGTSLELI